MEQSQTFLKELTRNSRRPEMRLFLTALLLAAAGLTALLFFLPAFLAWLAAGAYLVGGTIFTFFNLKTAQANTELEIKSKEFAAIIDDLDAGVISYDADFKIITFNKTAEKIFNLNAQEVVGQIFSPNFSKNPHFRQLTQVIFPSLAPVVRPVSESEAWPQIVDVTLEEPNRELRTSLNRLVDPQGKILGFFKIVRDRTREKAILASKSEFISVAAHQMRTPLNAINWAFESLAKTAKEKDSAETVQTGREVAQRTLKIVNDLLDVSRIEEGKFGYNFEETDLGEFIRTVVNGLKPVADQYQVSLYVALPKENIRLKIDRQKLEIALSNLIDNAVKYNVKNGKVEISAEPVTGSPFLKISVKDSGVGIPPQEMDKVFKKFFRGSNIIQMEPNGSGLGLYITKNIIQQHGGKIAVESIIDRGTTFSFTLPLDFSFIKSKEIGVEE